MANGIKLDLLADTRQFQAGTKDAAAALDDVSSSLDDLTQDAARANPKFGETYERNAQDASRALDRLDRDVSDLGRDTARVGADAGDDLSRGVTDGAQDGSRALDKLETKFRDVADAAKRETGSSGGIGGFGKSVKHEAEEASEGVATAKENIGSNLKEVAASFDGTAQGVADGFQGLVAEIAEGFGPAGLIAGAVVAGGIGLISSQLQTADEDSQTFKQHVADLAGELIDAGKDGQVGLGHISDELKSLATSTEPGEQSLSKLLDIADRAKASYRNLAQAYAGNSKDLGSLIKQEERHKEALNQQVRAQNLQTREGNLRAGALTKQASATGEYIDALRKTKAVTDEATKAERAYIKAGGPELQEKAEATEAYADSVQGALQEAGAGWEKYKTKQGVNLDAYNDNLEKSIKATENYQANVKTATQSLTQDALNYILSLGEDAAPLLQQYVDAPNKLRSRTASNWDALGKASSSSYNSALKRGIPDTVKGPRITEPSTASYEAAIRNALARSQRFLDAHPLQAGAIAYTDKGKPIFG